MAQTTTPPQLPPHVSAHLSHLTSRPGVQSTLILSRKDGSIIQATGLLASANSKSTGSSQPTTPPSAPEPTPGSAEEQTNPVPAANDITSGTAPSPPYKPSQAETLAAHIVAFVSSATALSTSLSPTNKEADSDGSNMNRHAKDEHAEAEGHEREEEEEVRLLRLRTKVHEIIIIPDRRFLLCVVHDATGGANAAAGGGGGGSR